MRPPYVRSIHVGKIAPLGPDGVPSGFVKNSINHSVEVTPLGLSGDEQADPSVHGGFEKAVYGYSHDNYSAWLSDYPKHAAMLVPGAFGENLCITGLLEADICVGDIHRIGSTRLQVCQPRQPCFKLALRFEDKMIAKAMVRSGRAGWYYRVLQVGAIAPNDSVYLEERPNPDFSFARLVESISGNRVTPAELERLQYMAGLSTEWRDWARDRVRQE